MEAAQHTPCRKVAARFGCAVSTVYRLVDLRKARGTSTSPPRAGRPPKLDERDSRRLERIVLANRQAPLDSLAVTRLVLTSTNCPKHTRLGETGRTWAKVETLAKVGDLDYDCDYEQ